MDVGVLLRSLMILLDAFGHLGPGLHAVRGTITQAQVVVSNPLPIPLAVPHQILLISLPSRQASTITHSSLVLSSTPIISSDLLPPASAIFYQLLLPCSLRCRLWICDLLVPLVHDVTTGVEPCRNAYVSLLLACRCRISTSTLSLSQPVCLNSLR